MFNLKKIILSLIFLSCSALLINAAEIKTIQVKFKRELYEKKFHKEITKGIIYWEKGRNIYLEVNYPVNQQMLLQGNSLIIYYPNQKKAFKIIAKAPFVLPFFQQFVGVVEEDYGLSKLKYKLINHKVTNDILYTYWKPPKILSKYAGDFILGHKKNKLVYAETKSHATKKVTKIYYSNHIKYKDIFFPLKIKTVQYLNKKEVFKEILIYRKPIFNKPLPRKVRNFKIPSNIKIKVVRW